MCLAARAVEADSESCFQATTLRYASPTQRILRANDSVVVATVPAVRLSTGTTPAGSEWTRNPVPLEDGTIRYFTHPVLCSVHHGAWCSL